MQKQIICVIVILLMVGCGKSDLVDTNEKDKHLPKFTLRSSTNMPFESDAHLLESPDEELLGNVYNLLSEWDGWYDFSTTLQDESCRVRWNWSTLDKMEGGDYTVFIPVTNNQNAICLYIMYATTNDHAHIFIKSIQEIIQATENFTKMDIDASYIPFIVKTAIYDYYIYRRTDSRLASWFQQYFTLNENYIQTRTSWNYYWVDSYVINGLWDSYIQSSKVYYSIPCPIDGQGIKGGGVVNDEDDDWKDGWFNGVGGDGPDNNETDNSNPLVETYKDCLEEHAGMGLISLLSTPHEIPCSDLDENDIAEILEELCDDADSDSSISGLEGNNSPGYSFGVNEYSEAIGSDDIIIQENSFINCRKVKCVYDLLNSKNNGLFCSTFGDLFDSDNFNLNLSTVPRNKIDWFGEASTSFDGNDITIKIADDLCDGDDHPLVIAGTLLHEAIHASMYQQALEQDPTLNATDYCSIWQINFQTNDPCHEIMATQYVNQLAQAIADLDNNRFDLDHYLYIAWSGLSSVGEEIGLLDDEYISEYSDEHDELINAPFDECK